MTKSITNDKNKKKNESKSKLEQVETKKNNNSI